MPLRFLAALLFLTTPCIADESWYLAIDLGYPSISYHSKLQSVVDAQTSSGAAHLPIALGFSGYTELKEGSPTLIGGTLQLVSDSYTQLGATTSSFGITNIAGSLMHFMGEKIGTGFFVRGDCGLSVLSQRTNSLLSSQTESGLAIGGAAGFVLPVTDKANLLTIIGYSRSFLQSGASDWKFLSVGVFL